MPAPANDNFANAQALTADAGSIVGTNIGATAEAGFEPANQGHTVWYSWSPSQNLTGGYVFFSTLPTGNLTKPLLRSEIRIFTYDPSAGFAEIAPKFGANNRYGGVSPGGYLIFYNPEPGNTIYIRVDSSPYSTPGVDDQGSFVLSWGPSDGPPRLGSCGNCISDFGLKVTCVGSFNMPADLTKGDVRAGIAYAVQRGPSLELPAGKYMLRYCAGHYLMAYSQDIRFGEYVWGVYAFTNTGSVSNSLMGSACSLLFHSGRVDGLTLSPCASGPPGTTASQGFLQPGDFQVGFNKYQDGDVGEVGTVGVAWWDGTQWQPTDDSGYPNWNNIGYAFGYPGQTQSTPVVSGGGNPSAPLISLIQNPCIQFAVPAGITDPNVPSWFPVGDVPESANGYPAVDTVPIRPQPNSPYINTPPFLNEEYACEANIFHHTGGKMNWVSAVCLGTAYYVDQYENQHWLDDGINVDLTALFTVFEGGIDSHGPACFVWVDDNNGAPKYNLMRILPDISLVSVFNTFDNSTNNLTATGQKNARFDLTIKNASVIGWENVTFTPTGFILSQDANPYPTPPQTVNIPASNTLDFHESWVMTNPVGTITVTLSDADGNPYPSFAVDVTPVFMRAPTTLQNGPPISIQNTQANINGQPCAQLLLNCLNNGNGCALAAQGVVSITAGGQPVPIAVPASFGGDGQLHNSFTWSPYFGIGNPGTWQPGAIAGLEFFVPLTNQAQNLVITIDFTDSGNSFPPVQYTIQIPAAP